MALKDLVSDLSNFNGRSQYDGLDSQIENGVDFIPNTDAPGFTPKTDLESLYIKANSAVLAKPPGFVPASDGQFSQTWGSNFPTQFKNGFFPIADAVSNYNPPENNSLTFDINQHISSGPTQFIIKPFDKTPQYENAHGNSLLPTQNLFDFKAFRERDRTSETAPFHSSVEAPFSNVSLPNIFSPSGFGVEFGLDGGTNLRDRYKDGSIHIFSDDTKEPIGGNVSKFARLKQGNHKSANPFLSQFSSPNTIGDTNTSTTPEGFTGLRTSLNLIKEFSTGPTSRRVEGKSLLDSFSNSKSSGFNAITLEKTFNDGKFINIGDDVEKLVKFRNNNFTNVPSGINDKNVNSFSDFRTVANRGPHEGKNLHPIILRKPTPEKGLENRTNWDNYLSEKGIISQKGFFQGALSVFGLLTRTSVGLADKQRIGTYLLSDPGKLFIAKQAAFQLLNPTIESKIYNPLSTVGIAGLSDLLSGDPTQALDGILRAAGSFLFPTHVERHLGGGRYEDIMPLRTLPNTAKLLLPGAIQSIIPDSGFNEQAKYGFGSRLALQSNPEIIPEVSAYGYTIGGKDLGTSLLFMNPNKYLFPISSAPKSIGPDGRISFLGGPRFAKVDADRAEAAGGPKSSDGETRGGTFNPKTHEFGLGSSLKDYKTKPYKKLNHNHSYYDLANNQSDRFHNYGRSNHGDDTWKGPENEALHNQKLNDMNNQGGVHGNLGQQGSLLTMQNMRGFYSSNKIAKFTDNGPDTVYKGDTNSAVGPGDAKSNNVDKVNMIPYGSKIIGEQTVESAMSPQKENQRDFIKFRFRDVVNNKYIVFRAILDGISDSISPEFGEEKYIGRPDKVYIYQGTERNVSFNFKVYPKTKQELPVLMEKLNYLVGLCYPSHTEGNRMVTPLMQLTIGDMFKDATGLLGGLTVTVEDATTWEIDEGLQFPHFISAQCEFKYIGDNILDSRGKHYGIGWLPDGSDLVERYKPGGKGLNFNQFPERSSEFLKNTLFRGLDQVD